MLKPRSEQIRVFPRVSALIRGPACALRRQELDMVVNGEKRAYRPGLGLHALLEELKVDGRSVAVMVGDEVYRPGRIPDVTLHDGDVVEVVSMMQGG